MRIASRKKKKKLVRRVKMAFVGALMFCIVLRCIAYGNDSDKEYEASMVYEEVEAEKEVTDDVIKEVVAEKETEVTDEENVQEYVFTEEEAYLLCKIAMAEAESEDTYGKALVICVVLNRVASEEFPDTIEEVIYQSGQFTPISNGRWDAVVPDEDCIYALQLVRRGWDDSCGALYFESNGTTSWHKDNLDFLFQYGNHYFYAGV